MAALESVTKLEEHIKEIKTHTLPVRFNGALNLPVNVLHCVCIQYYGMIVLEYTCFCEFWGFLFLTAN